MYTIERYARLEGDKFGKYVDDKQDGMLGMCLSMDWMCVAESISLHWM